MVVGCNRRARWRLATWGKIDFLPNNAVIPYAAGIPRGCESFISLCAVSTNVEELEADVKYQATFFDPLTGERSQPREVQPANGPASGAATAEAGSRLGRHPDGFH